eukprot:scaffold24734_cov61-Phaeocystis_antarctica.AAC.10
MYCAVTGVAKSASKLPLVSVKVAPPSTLLHEVPSVPYWTVNAGLSEGVRPRIRTPLTITALPALISIHSHAACLSVDHP